MASSQHGQFSSSSVPTDDVAELSLDFDDAVTTYRTMLLIRRFEEKAGQLYALGVIEDEIKLCIGREALIVGLMMARQSNDAVVVGQRCHGHLLALGASPSQLMTELATDVGSLMRDPIRLPKLGAGPATFHRIPAGVSDIVQVATNLSGQQPHTGVANVVFAVLDGDQVAEQGDAGKLCQAFRDAQQHRSPVVMIVDQAQPATTNPSQHDLHAALLDASTGSGVPFQTVNGIDVVNVRNACCAAANLARSGGGPRGLLISTQAFRGHGERSGAGSGDSARAREANDPILSHKTQLLAGRFSTLAPPSVPAQPSIDQVLTAIEDDIRTSIAAAGHAARQA
ncbi:MAG: hypothetical protein K0U34_05720 [Alphaproteobacteria bacterium]|nr:hypothetical protein [Alphaproteobacteria bacterium]